MPLKMRNHTFCSRKIFQLRLDMIKTCLGGAVPLQVFLQVIVLRSAPILERLRKTLGSNLTLFRAGPGVELTSEIPGFVLGGRREDAGRALSGNPASVRACADAGDAIGVGLEVGS